MQTSSNQTPRSNQPEPTAVRSHTRTKRIPGARRIRAKELPVFSRQLAAMYSSGIPVVQALEAAEEQTTVKEFKPVIRSLQKGIEAGGTLSDSCARYPEIFDDLFVNMVRAGEAGGILAETLSRMAGFLEASQRLRSKVKSAMMYPTIVLFVAFALSFGMIVFIVPVFGSIYGEFGAALPGPTAFLMRISEVVRHHSLVVICIMVGGAMSFVRWKGSESGKLKWDGIKLGFPVFGDLMVKVSLARFASTYAQLMRSGVPILRSLDIVSDAMGNKYLGSVIHDSKVVVERGEALSSALKKGNRFPPILVHMLSAGEQTGLVNDMMENIAEFYEDEVNNTLAGLTSLIEPILIVFLGVVIGGIVVAMFLPIFKMHTIVGF